MMLRRYLSYLRLALVLTAALAVAASFRLEAHLSGQHFLARRQRVTRWFLAQIAACLPIRITLNGAPPQHPALWLANHVSWTDIPLLGSLAPLSFLSKADVRDWPLAGCLAREAGTLFIQRGSGDLEPVIRELAGCLRQGHSLVIFPEGTTTDGSHLLPFHSRLLRCVTETGLPVQPVAICYRLRGQPDTRIAPFIGEDDLLSHLDRLLRQGQLEAEIHFLPEIETLDRNRSAVAREARDRVLQRLEQTAAARPALNIAA